MSTSSFGTKQPTVLRVSPSFADRNGSSYCDFCESGFFPKWAASRTRFQGCVVCPQGATCDPISGSIQATEDYWLSTNVESGAVQTFACPPNICLRGRCGPNRKPFEENPLCGQCADGFYEWGNECVQCQDGVDLGTVFLILIVSFICVVLYHFFSQRSSSELGIGLFFIQMASILTANMPGSSFRILAWFNFDLFGSECVAPMDPIVKLSSFIWITIFIFSHWFAFAMMTAFWRRHFQARCTAFRSRHFQKRCRWLMPSSNSNKISSSPSLTVEFGRSSIALYTFTFNSIVRGSFRVFDCVNLQVDGSSLSVVRSYPAVTCDSAGYRSLLFLSVAFASLYLIVIPLVLLWASHRWRTESSTGYEVLAAIRASYNTQRSPGGSWELLKLMNRVAILACLVFIEDPYQRLNAASLFFATYIVAVVHRQPFNRACQLADEASHFILLILCQVLMLLAPDTTSEDRKVLSVLTLLPSACFVLWIIRSKVGKAAQRILERLQAGQLSRIPSQKWSDLLANSCTSCLIACMKWLVSLESDTEESADKLRHQDPTRSLTELHMVSLSRSDDIHRFRASSQQSNMVNMVSFSPRTTATSYGLIESGTARDDGPAV